MSSASTRTTTPSTLSSSSSVRQQQQPAVLLLSALSIRRRKALADALAGVVATLVSLWTFYPIDVFKTKLQAGTNDADSDDAVIDKTASRYDEWVWTDLFRGLSLKTLHAASSSFCYFYLYSTIASWWMTHHNHKDANQKMSPAVRLTLSAVAAMMNTLLTLPLDVLASQKQAGTTTTTTTRVLVVASKNDAVVPGADETQDESISSSSSELLLQEEEEDHKGDELRVSLLDEQQQQQMEQVWNHIQQASSSPLAEDCQSASELEEEHDGDVFYDTCSEPSSFDSYDAFEEEERKTEDDDENNNHEFVSPTTTIRRGRVTLTVTTTTTPTTASSDPQEIISNNNSHCKKLFHAETTTSTTSTAPSSSSSISNNNTSRHEDDGVGRDEHLEEPPANQSLSSSSSGNKNRHDNTAESFVDLLSQYTCLWKGLYPSLLLCSNPSIHYTVFDMAKSHLVQSRRASSSNNINHSNLSMTEAFLVGLFAKFCATMATYPLIRAKVMLMVTSCSIGSRSTSTNNQKKKKSHTMIQILLNLYRTEGIGRGLYKGCSVQLMHTVLKSALLMMVKEHISHTTHRLLVPQQQQHS